MPRSITSVTPTRAQTSPWKPYHRKSKSLPYVYGDTARVLFRHPATSQRSRTTPTMAPVAPDTTERLNYYYGLPSRPKLVARSSIHPYEWQGDSWPIGKRFGVVGANHPIACAWNDASGSLRREILRSVEGIQWTALDILRIGYCRVAWSDDDEPPDHQPVTFLISVKPGSTTWVNGIPIVMECRRILVQHGLDVQCEMKEAEVFRCVSLAGEVKLKGGKVHGFDEAKQLNYYEHLGTSIAAVEAPRQEGTKCLYVRRKDTGAALALTCRHVVFQGTETNETYSYDESLKKRLVIQPGNKILEDIQQNVNEQAKEVNTDVSMILGSLTLSEAEKNSQIESLQTDLESRKVSVAGIESAESRCIGHVLFSPKFGLGFGRLRDWTLIELNQAKYESSLAALGNRIAVQATTRRNINSIATRCGNFEVSLDIDHDTQLLKLGGIITEAEFHRPRTTNKAKDLCIMVLKHGRTTGLTVGFTNGVKSIIRHRLDDIIFDSEELCIIGEIKKDSFTRTPFSERGDSGACVWDTTGRIGAMMTGGGGNRENGAHDVTYATPIEWLLEDLRGHGIDVELV